MRKSLDRFAEVCWRQVNKERGNYGVMDSWEGGKDSCEKPFMMAQVIQGLRSYWELTGSERTADQIYGMADFILEESSLGPWGFNYVVLIDAEQNKAFRAAKRAEADKDGKHVSYGHLAWVLAWVYRHYGDQRFRTMIDGINPKAYPYVPRGYTGYYPERSDKSAPEAIQDLTAKAIGGGKVQLSWTAPAGEPVRYQVKWADQTDGREAALAGREGRQGQLVGSQSRDGRAETAGRRNQGGDDRRGHPGRKEILCHAFV